MDLYSRTILLAANAYYALSKSSVFLLLWLIVAGVGMGYVGWEAVSGEMLLSSRMSAYAPISKEASVVIGLVLLPISLLHFAGAIAIIVGLLAKKDGR